MWNDEKENVKIEFFSGTNFLVYIDRRLVTLFGERSPDCIDKANKFYFYTVGCHIMAGDKTIIDMIRYIKRRFFLFVFYKKSIRRFHEA